MGRELSRGRNICDTLGGFTFSFLSFFYIFNVFKKKFYNVFVIKNVSQNSTSRNSKNVRKYFLRLERCSIGHCTLNCFTRVRIDYRPIARNEMSILFDTFNQSINHKILT